MDHPHIHYHSYEDFPPDFYKADFYDQYRQITGVDWTPYSPLKIHSYGDNGFYYYDDHPQTSFRDETGYEAYIAGHQMSYSNNSFD